MSSWTPAICWCSVPCIGARRGTLELMAMSSRRVPASRIAHIWPGVVGQFAFTLTPRQVDLNHGATATIIQEPCWNAGKWWEGLRISGQYEKAVTLVML